ncbi:uncharacterized protein F4807DRAFT_409809 [Annulohypoxylon truncatum]|uniref:uncharacterized protein n=1 Tax=Annulohypoxylon truncatum TaxID=327061 RepID=UPI0020079957|nr:uncharacterized protein F4807DRAFT_409809 [Annulohypoxylon truncatum]KAI1213928.1 hypothetical protein F4807DRAFT_409809 [Annulohypoxylon truncatum]
MTSLEVIFGELGISQYLEAFFDQGFDSWETILDITESDLDALGVKLGHRRKLQRRIANYRGVAPETSLVSPTRTSIEDAKLDSNRIEPLKSDKPDGAGVAKRKYRRHPKPDENAPERPPSAYVLFSNKMREDLKGQNLTFTEIAKLVGENWQNLTRDEKEPFERQAHEAKEKYNRELADYKKTAEYRKYCDYLHEFRKRQAAQLQEKDVSKRLKTEADSIRGSSTSGGSTGASGTTSGTVSGSDSQPGSEPPPSRQQRMGSSASTVESSFSPGLNAMHHGDDQLHSPRTILYDEPNSGRPRGLSSPTSRDLTMHSSRRPGWADSQRMYGESPSTVTSWFDPRGVTGTLVHSPENGLPNSAPIHGPNGGSGRGSRSSGSASMSRPPSLKTEQSSTGSVSSLNSYAIPRTPSDASLPIHALLTKPETSYPPCPAPAQQAPLPIFQPQSGRPPGDQSSGNGFPPGPTTPKYSIPSLQKEGTFSGPAESKASPTSKFNSSNENTLDGISALLKAREIVDRQ